MSSIATTLPMPNWRYANGKPVLRLVLLIALVLHAALLLIPGPRPGPPVMTHTLDVRLEPATLEPAAESTPMPEPLPAVLPEPQPVPVEPAEQPEPAPVTLPEPPAATEPPRAETRPPVTTALLLLQARHLDLAVEKAPIRIPGVPWIPDLPANLVRPVLPFTPTVFSEHFITGEQEVIDQWMEPNGTINAVIRLPNGDIVCGRAEPWDETNPLFEPVAMYRSCGGGGRQRPASRSPFLARD